jgi:putative flippase GtrA
VGFVSRTAGALRTHGRRGLAFLVVGLGGAVIDLGTFNSLVYWGGHGPMSAHPVTAKALSTLLAVVATYFGNAWLTYRDRTAPLSGRQGAMYLALNLAAIIIQVACLGFSRYVLGLNSQLSDNVFGTGLGLVFATAFRYFAYSRWVFPDERVEIESRTPSGRSV